MNKGSVEVSVKGNLLRDYKGKFEKTASQKFMRSIYEKWVIYSRIKEYEGKLIEDCNEFLAQAKAFLDLEGKR
jgi:isocitrate dehydrogenase